MKNFISIVGANLLVGSLFGAPVINIHKVTSNDGAKNEISNKKISAYSNIQISVSGVTTKSNVSSNNYALTYLDTFLKNSNIFFNDTSYVELNNTLVSVSSYAVDSGGYIISSSFDFNITLNGDNSLFNSNTTYGVLVKDAPTGAQTQTSLYEIDNTKPQIVSASSSGSLLYIIFTEDLSDGDGTNGSNGVVLTDLNSSDFTISTTGVTLSNASFASGNKKKLKFDVSGTSISTGDINISGAISSRVKDITGNPLDSTTKVTIKPAPMVLNAKTVDSTTFTFEYSKTMTVGDANTSCADKISNYSILSSTNNSISGVSIDSIATSNNDKTFTFTLSGGTIQNSGELVVSGVSYSGWQVSVNSAVADSAGTYTINDSGETVFTINDYIPANPSSPIFYDENSNGKIDKLEISFDEPMNKNISSMGSGKLAVTHSGNTVSGSFNLNALSWSSDGKKLYIPTSNELDGTGISSDEVTLTGLGSNLTDANGNIETNNLTSTTPSDKAAPVLSSIEFYDNYGMNSFSTTDGSSDFNSSGVKEVVSSDILRIYFSETLNSLDDTKISISTDYGNNYTALVDGKVGLSSDSSYAIVDLGNASVDINALMIKTSSGFATDSSGNSITSDKTYSASYPIANKSIFYIDSNTTLSASGSKVIVSFSENIDKTVINNSNSDFSKQFTTTCGGSPCSGVATQIIDDKTISVDFNTTDVDNNITFNYIASSYKLQNSDNSKDLKDSSTLLTKTVQADSLNTNGSFDFMTIKGVLYQADDSIATMGTVLSAFLATDAYEIRVNSSDTINSELIGGGSYIITPQDNYATLSNGITIGNVSDINVSINYNDSNITLSKGSSSISFSKAQSNLIDEVRVIEPYVVESTVITQIDGSYSLKIRNPHGRNADIIILAKSGENGDYYPVTSPVNEADITVAGDTVHRHLEFQSVFGTSTESKIVNLSMKNIKKIALTQVNNKKFNTFYLPVKKSYYENGNSAKLTPSANRLNANSDLTNLELTAGYDLDDILLSIKTENSKTVPYLIESNFDLNTRAVKEGLTNCIKYDGNSDSSANGISGFKTVTAGYGIGCYIPEYLNLYFFGNPITSSDKINSVASVSTWAMVGNWRYSGSLSGASNTVSPTLDSDITQINHYNSNIESSLYNLKVSNDTRETINFSTTQNGDDAVFIQFNSGTTVEW